MVNSKNKKVAPLAKGDLKHVWIVSFGHSSIRYHCNAHLIRVGDRPFVKPAIP
jgi:hypothetical protein